METASAPSPPYRIVTSLILLLLALFVPVFNGGFHTISTLKESYGSPPFPRVDYQYADGHRTFQKVTDYEGAWFLYLGFTAAFAFAAGGIFAWPVRPGDVRAAFWIVFGGALILVIRSFF